MPTLIVDNVPPEIYEHLRRRAAAGRRSVLEETLHLLAQALREDKTPSPRLPDLIAGEEISAPCDLPRSSRPVAVPAHDRPGAVLDHRPTCKPGEST
jgi:plasmid stability protein